MSVIVKGIEMPDTYEECRARPADVRPVVRGRWIRHYCDDDGVPDGWSCDKCKEWYVFGPSKPNFCPNCGADMREANL